MVKWPSGPRPPYVWGHGNPIVISFTSQGKKTTGWESGKTWGLRIYDWVRPGAKDKEALFTLRMQATPLTQQSPTRVGPNKVLVPPPAPAWTATPRNTQAPATLPSTSPVPTGASPTSPAPGHNLLSDTDLLWSTVVRPYHILNTSRPDLTKSCWLCLDVWLLYYEGSAIKGNYTTASNSSSYRWQQTTARLNLQAVTGQGTCIGHVPPRAVTSLY